MIRLMEEADLEAVAELERICFSENWSYKLLESGFTAPMTPTMCSPRTDRFSDTAIFGFSPGRARCRESR